MGVSDKTPRCITISAKHRLAAKRGTTGPSRSNLEKSQLHLSSCEPWHYWFIAQSKARRPRKFPENTRCKKINIDWAVNWFEENFN